MSKLLKIKNNITNDFVTVGVTSYGVAYNKIWGSSVTNMEGSTRATLIGVKPTVSATTFPLYQQQANTVSELLEQGYVIVQFLDTASGEIKEEPFTASDIDVELIREHNRWYKEISFTLTAINTRNYE